MLALFFVIINYTIYIFIDPFHNGDPKEVSWNNTLKRLNCSPCRPSSTEAKQNPQQQQQKKDKKEKFGIIEQLFKQPFASHRIPIEVFNVLRKE